MGARCSFVVRVPLSHEHSRVSTQTPSSPVYLDPMFCTEPIERRRPHASEAGGEVLQQRMPYRWVTERRGRAPPDRSRRKAAQGRGVEAWQPDVRPAS